MANIEDKGLAEKPSFQNLAVNDRERFIKGTGMAVLQFTDTGWDLFDSINKGHGFREYSTYELNALMEKGVWCKAEKKPNNDLLLNILAGSFIFYTALAKAEADPSAQNRPTSRFVVTKTAYARQMQNKKELESFLDYGVYVKTSWRVNKPSEKGHRRHERPTDYSAELYGLIFGQQSQYTLQLSEKDVEAFEKLDRWKEFVVLNEKVDKDLTRKNEVVYTHFRPSPDYAIEGNVFRFFLEGPVNSLKPAEVVSFFGYYGQTRAQGKGTIRQIDKEFIDVRIMDYYPIDRIPVKGKMVSDFHNRSYQIQLETITHLAGHNRQLSRIIEDPKLSTPPDRAETEIHNSLIKANKAQVEAVQKAIGTKDLFLIQGPPGTGKTSVITEIIEQYAAAGKKVLISSQSNLAVDNVFEKIGNHPSIKSIRAGKEERILDTVIPYKLENRAVEMQQEISSHVKTQMEQDQETIRTAGTCQDSLNKLMGLYEQAENARKGIVETERKRKELFEVSDVPANLEKKKIEKELDMHEDLLLRLTTKNDLIRMDLEDIRSAGKENLVAKLKVQFLTKQAAKNTQKIPQVKEQIVSLKARVELLQRQITAEVKATAGYERTVEQIARMNQQIQAIQTEIVGILENLPEIIAEGFYPGMGLSEANGAYQELASLGGHVKARAALMEDWLEFLKTDEESLHRLLIENVDVIGSTCIGVATDHNLDGIEFDVAIIDEASRATVPETLVPMARAQKTILVGDHKQLPPTISYEVDLACEESGFPLPYKQSLFEQLIEQTGPHSSVMLTEQFRMNPLISGFISDSFYSGKYKAGAGTEEKMFPSLFFDKPLCFIDTANYQDKGEKKIPKQGYSNELEAELVVKSLKQIVKDIKEKELEAKVEVGVIASYKRQKQLILSKVNDAGLDTSLIDIEVETLDAFQGREKDIIIFSFTRSNRWGELGFSKELYRINVGLSRARKLLILVGDSATLKTANEEKANIVLNQLIQYILLSGNFKVVWTEQPTKETAR
ncbi:DEAD/DEAH box helicase [Mesobacillus jeotgali]|uniref:DEAD/DEAH box helicase n=1 Tax=Mesobacillus jeotgali TaxID=129985 RepID=UPI001CFC9F17|nr:AAA domain-containing protein [Mesobacillus jeotgali]